MQPSIQSQSEEDFKSRISGLQSTLNVARDNVLGQVYRPQFRDQPYYRPPPLPADDYSRPLIRFQSYPPRFPPPPLSSPFPRLPHSYNPRASRWPRSHDPRFQKFMGSDRGEHQFFDYPYFEKNNRTLLHINEPFEYLPNSDRAQVQSNRDTKWHSSTKNARTPARTAQGVGAGSRFEKPSTSQKSRGRDDFTHTHDSNSSFARKSKFTPIVRNSLKQDLVGAKSSSPNRVDSLATGPKVTRNECANPIQAKEKAREEQSSRETSKRSQTEAKSESKIGNQKEKSTKSNTSTQHSMSKHSIDCDVNLAKVLPETSDVAQLNDAHRATSRKKIIRDKSPKFIPPKKPRQSKRYISSEFLPLNVCNETPTHSSEKHAKDQAGELERQSKETCNTAPIQQNTTKSQGLLSGKSTPSHLEGLTSGVCSPLQKDSESLKSGASTKLPLLVSDNGSLLFGDVLILDETEKTLEEPMADERDTLKSVTEESAFTKESADKKDAQSQLKLNIVRLNASEVLTASDNCSSSPRSITCQQTEDMSICNEQLPEKSGREDSSIGDNPQVQEKISVPVESVVIPSAASGPGTDHNSDFTHTQNVANSTLSETKMATPCPPATHLPQANDLSVCTGTQEEVSHSAQLQLSSQPLPLSSPTLTPATMTLANEPSSALSADEGALNSLDLERLQKKVDYETTQLKTMKIPESNTGVGSDTSPIAAESTMDSENTEGTSQSELSSNQTGVVTHLPVQPIVQQERRLISPKLDRIVNSLKAKGSPCNLQQDNVTKSTTSSQSPRKASKRKTHRYQKQGPETDQPKRKKMKVLSSESASMVC